MRIRNRLCSLSRPKKIILNCFFILLLLLVLLNLYGVYLSPIASHNSNERQNHYGPSKIIHIEDYNGGKYLLCKYDQWISIDDEKRSLFFFWSKGNYTLIEKNDSSKPVVYTWESSYSHLLIYGIVNNSAISRIEVTFKNGNVLSQNEFYDGLFLIPDLDVDNYPTGISAYDKNNRKLLEQPFQ